MFTVFARLSPSESVVHLIWNAGQLTGHPMYRECAQMLVARQEIIQVTPTGPAWTASLDTAPVALATLTAAAEIFGGSVERVEGDVPIYPEIDLPAGAVG